MKLISQKLLIAAAVLLVASAGCDRRADDRATAELVLEDAAKKQPARVDEPEPVKPADAGGAKPAEGQVCERDADCRTYYRCLDGTCSVPPAMTGVVRDDTPVAVFSKDGTERARFRLELAITPPEKTRGLMYRRSMLDDWGMLFVYPKDGPRSFWMKNTLIPLDMVFIASSGEVVGVIEGAEPMTLSPRTVEPAARYVLELNAGIAAKSGVVPGVKMSLENASEDIRPTP